MLLIVLMVLVGLAVVADRIALGVAEDRAASALQTSQDLTHKPDVTVEGFPFLTQLASGELRRGRRERERRDRRRGARRAHQTGSSSTCTT